MAKIVVSGSLNMDAVAVTPRIPIAGETILGSRFFTTPGGKGANQAYAAARLGGDVAMVGRVGDDAFGIQMRNGLADAGCAVEGIRVFPGASGVAVIYVSERGENSIVVVPGANQLLTPGDIALERGLFDGCLAVLLQLETPLETVIAAARLAHEQGARVILDPAPAPSSPLPRELLEAVDILTPNETEAAILTGSAHKPLSPGEAAAIALKLQALGPPAVIVKLGAQGCLLWDDCDASVLPAPTVTAVDTTAAGDVFNGALAVALSEGLTLKQACQFAVQASALSVTRMGAQSSIPTRAEVESFQARRAS
ncbi:MAG TPA: ribokinase [Bryobacteraceae bacterium]|nr:ribokinase [Bryobacteraceae bacterium]